MDARALKIGFCVATEFSAVNERIEMTSEELKAFCKERNLTYKELAELIGMTEPSLSGAISTNKISLQTEKAVELLKEVESLKSELADWHAIKNLMQKNFTK